MTYGFPIFYFEIDVNCTIKAVYLNIAKAQFVHKAQTHGMAFTYVRLRNCWNQ